MSDSIKFEKVKGSTKLYIIFGGVAAGIGMPPFEFAKASNILDQSRVFVRDLRQNWYQCGLQGISEDIDSTKTYLENLIKEESPEEVVMIGNSMGGYAAILFSALIENSRSVVFAPQTFVSLSKRLRYGDFRWQKRILRTYYKARGKDTFYDLKELKPVSGCQIEIHVAATDRLDRVHAQNVSSLSCVKIHEYNFGGHNLVKSLRDKGELSKILTKAH